MSTPSLFSAFIIGPLTSRIFCISPFFDKATINLPGAARPLVITSTGAPSNKYVKSLSIDGVPVDSASPIFTHDQIKNGANIVFEMSATPQAWGSQTIFVGPGGK